MKLCPKCQKQFSDDANFCPVCAARLQPLEGDPAGTDGLAVRFELGAHLGGARTGAVHQAVDKQNGNKAVAVKVVAPAVLALPGVAQRLDRELKQLERVSSAGVAKVVVSGKRPGKGGDETYLATELLDGAQSLADVVTSRGPISVELAAHLIEVIGEALIEAAQVGVVHRDLAPKNVLFAGTDVKLINFSLPVPTSDKIPGVPEFVAPEQVEGKPVDQRSNLYSLGALYYYVLTGQTVVSGPTPDAVHAAHAAGTITPPSKLAAVPPPVEQLILRALDRSPTKRFLTVRQFVDEVGRVARGEGDVKSTMPMGKVVDKAGARPKAELVQTLLGVRSGPVATPAAAPASAPIASAPTVGGVSALAPSVLGPAPAAAVQSTMVGVSSGVSAAPPAEPAPTAKAANAEERSPWAPTPPAPAPVAPTPAAPAVPAAAPAAPVVAKPTVAAKPDGPAGKKKAPEEEKKGGKGKFRETMWFKKGELDAEAAESAAAEHARTGKEVVDDKADSLPIDERYKDDGSISRGDKEKYSLRTGATQMMSAIKDDPGVSGTNARVSEDALIGEMKGGRNTVLIVLVAAIAAIGLVVFLFAR